MKTVMLGICPSFHCLAGECPSTCCSGWRILVGAKDYERFLQMDPVWLREDILSNIQKKDGEYFFRNQKNGRCAMLDADGLCRIQRNSDEKSLCNTCRKYPRVMNQVGTTLYLSMAASCPVISDYLIQGTVSWLSDGQKAERVLLSEREWDIHAQNKAAAEQIFQEKPNAELLYGCFEKMASGVLDIVLRYREGLEFLTVFEALGQEQSERVFPFCRDTASVWSKLLKNYIGYRLLSRKIEAPKETPKESVRQVYGELFLLRTAAFCEYVKRGKVREESLGRLVRMVYRFCAHGKNVSGDFSRLTASFFSKDYFWYYLLL